MDNAVISLRFLGRSNNAAWWCGKGGQFTWRQRSFARTARVRTHFDRSILVLHCGRCAQLPCELYGSCHFHCVLAVCLCLGVLRFLSSRRHTLSARLITPISSLFWAGIRLFLDGRPYCGGGGDSTGLTLDNLDDRTVKKPSDSLFCLFLSNT